MSSAGTDIAIIGMAGRFPGAKTLAQFWRNLTQGVESVSFFPQDPGFPTSISPGKYVPARAVVARGPLYRARKEFISRTTLTNNFGVDAVLPADLGGAPRASRQHTKAICTASMAGVSRQLVLMVRRSYKGWQK